VQNAVQGKAQKAALKKQETAQPEGTKAWLWSPQPLQTQFFSGVSVSHDFSFSMQFFVRLSCEFAFKR